MSEGKIRIATSIPSLKNKVQTRLVGSTDAIFWYIRFNIPLDESSVSEKTMEVTDTEGYIMRTDITYDAKMNMIMISPLDTYEQNRFYLLSISKKVRSARGQNLRSDIHILFKLLEDKISNYKVLRKDVKVPRPKPRPPDYDQRQIGRKPNAFDQAYEESGTKDRMTTVSFSINILLGLLGLLVVGAGAAANAAWLVIAGAFLCMGGLIHIYVQSKKPELSSTLSFNKGVRKFNKARYADAKNAFKKSLEANPRNELAKYGLYKASLYL